MLEEAEPSAFSRAASTVERSALPPRHARPVRGRGRRRLPRSEHRRAQRSASSPRQARQGPSRRRLPRSELPSRRERSALCHGRPPGAEPFATRRAASTVERSALTSSPRRGPSGAEGVGDLTRGEPRRAQRLTSSPREARQGPRAAAHSAQRAPSSAPASNLLATRGPSGAEGGGDSRAASTVERSVPNSSLHPEARQGPRAAATPAQRAPSSAASPTPRHARPVRGRGRRRPARSEQ